MKSIYRVDQSPTTMIVPVRVLQFTASCLLTLFLLTSISLYAILERSVDDDGGEQQQDLLSNGHQYSSYAGTASSLAGTGAHQFGGRIMTNNKDNQLEASLSKRGDHVVAPDTGFMGSSPSKRFFRGGGSGGSSSKTYRKIFEEKYPPNDMDRISKSVANLRDPMPATLSNMTYDIMSCPAIPPQGYPQEWNLANGILRDWNPDDTEVPNQIYQGLCVFDWNADGDRTKADTYRKAELPFVLQNHPDVMKASERWGHPSYLKDLVGPKPQRNEYSKTNKFMFWRTTGFLRRDEIPKGWKPPTEVVQLSFDDWMKKAQQLEATTNTRDHVEEEHWYFRLNGIWRHSNEYLYDELPFFVPGNEPTLFMVEPDQQAGINCRFGMKGVTAESHYDQTRNWIMLLGGKRRYVLSHPNQCRNLELYPVTHPSGRHSKVDWTRPLSDTTVDSPFRKATANEVILQAGDALYLPTSWFHFIVSLNINYQCNARSGFTNENDHYLNECGLGL